MGKFEASGVGLQNGADGKPASTLAGNEEAQAVHFRMVAWPAEPKENRDGFAVDWAMPSDVGRARPHMTRTARS